jgi:hypothetical protein
MKLVLPSGVGPIILSASSHPYVRLSIRNEFSTEFACDFSRPSIIERPLSDPLSLLV